MSIKSDSANSLDNYLCQDLLETEPTIVSTTKECTAVEDRITETNPKASVRGLIFIAGIPAFRVSLTHI